MEVTPLPLPSLICKFKNYTNIISLSPELASNLCLTHE